MRVTFVMGAVPTDPQMVVEGLSLSHGDQPLLAAIPEDEIEASRQIAQA